MSNFGPILQVYLMKGNMKLRYSLLVLCRLCLMREAWFVLTVVAIKSLEVGTLMFDIFSCLDLLVFIRSFLSSNCSLHLFMSTSWFLIYHQLVNLFTFSTFPYLSPIFQGFVDLLLWPITVILWLGCSCDCNIIRPFMKGISALASKRQNQCLSLLTRFYFWTIYFSSIGILLNKTSTHKPANYSLTSNQYRREHL